MRSLLTAAALCAALQGAWAQGTCAPAATGAPAAPRATTAGPATAAYPPAALSRGATALPVAAAAPAHGELIKTAGAATRDGLPGAGVPRMHEQHPQHGGIAMLLAALALMSGIALRRYGGPRA